MVVASFILHLLLRHLTAAGYTIILSSFGRITRECLKMIFSDAIIENQLSSGEKIPDRTRKSPHAGEAVWEI